MRRGAKALLEIFREANRQNVPFTEGMFSVIMDVFCVTKKDAEEVIDIFKADLREQFAGTPDFQKVKNMLARMSIEDPFGGHEPEDILDPIQLPKDQRPAVTSSKLDFDLQFELPLHHRQLYLLVCGIYPNLDGGPVYVSDSPEELEEFLKSPEWPFYSGDVAAIFQTSDLNGTLPTTRLMKLLTTLRKEGGESIQGETSEWREYDEADIDNFCLSIQDSSDWLVREPLPLPESHEQYMWSQTPRQSDTRLVTVTEIKSGKLLELPDHSAEWVAKVLNYFSK